MDKRETLKESFLPKPLRFAFQWLETTPLEPHILGHGTARRLIVEVSG